MSTLRSKVIRLAHANPSLRPHLLPLLAGGSRVAAADVDDFVDGYVEAMLFSSLDDGEVPLDRNYSESDIDPASLRKMKETCKKFLTMPGIGDLVDGRERDAGRDFWFTHNGHGAGFGDGDWKPAAAAKKLEAASEKFSESSVTVDGGKIFVD